jgi:hypothetical protein
MEIATRRFRMQILERFGMRINVYERSGLRLGLLDAEEGRVLHSVQH